MGGKSIISNSYLEDIGDAIRYKKGTEETFYPSQMGDAIRSIEGIVPTGTMEIDANGVYDVTEKASVDVDVNPDLRPLSVSENGSYQPDGFDGYSEVTVDVEPNLTSLAVTENGLYLPESGVDGFDRVSVDVPQPSGSTTITQNGTYNVEQYASAVVDVPATPLIDTIDVFNVQSKEIVIDQNWFNDSDIVVLVPHLEFSTRDWLYVNADGGTNSSYWPGANDTAYGTDGYRQSIFIVKIGSVYRICWFCDATNRNKMSTYDVTTSFFCRLYYGSSTMTGNIKVYGIKIPS